MIHMSNKILTFAESIVLIVIQYFQIYVILSHAILWFYAFYIVMKYLLGLSINLNDFLMKNSGQK